MSAWDRFKGFFSRQPAAQKESKTGSVLVTGHRQAEWTPRNYESFADEGYQKNVVAYQSINRVASAIADIPLVVRNKRTETEVTEGPLVDLLMRPNPTQSGAEWMRALVGFYLISGNGYIERTVAGGRPRELYTLRPDRMRVKPSSTGMPEGYAYHVGVNKVEWEADPMTGESDIRHLKAFNPLNDWYGMSPIEAGAFAVDQHNESMQWMQSLLQNGAAPSGAMTIQKDGQGNYGELTDDQYNRLKADLDEKYAGAKNAGRPMLLEGGLTWQQMGLSPQQMTIIDLKYSSARDIALAIGVPPMLLNIPGDNTFNNYKEARLSLYEDTCIPLARYIIGELNEWLVPMFGDQFAIELDLEGVPAIAEKRRELWSMANESNDLTINERREIKGYEPIDGGDQVFIQSSLLPLSFDTESMDDGLSLDGGDGATPQDGGGRPVQDLALNGAQIASVSQIVQNVADGLLPPDSAINMLRVAFPTIDDATARAIVNPAVSFSPNRPEAVRSHVVDCLVAKWQRDSVGGSMTPEELRGLAYGPDKTKDQ